ncbi:MAG: TetR/AcrR family transcriptional regulator [Tepidiformaceae bacterium]
MASTAAEPRTEESLDPRVARSRAAILDATAALLIEGGFGHVTIEGIAERSGVAKTTIYRHWKSRSQLIFDAFENLLQPGPHPRRATGLREGLIDMMNGLSRGLTDSPWAPAVAALVEAGDRDAELRGLVHDFLAERMEPVRRLLTDAVARGELDGGLDVDVAVSMLAGPVFYRRLVSREDIGPEFAERVVEQFLAGATSPPGPLVS